MTWRQEAAPAGPPPGGAGPARDGARLPVELVAPPTCEVGAPCLVSARVECPVDSRCELDTPGRLGAFEVLSARETGAAGTEGGLHEWRLALIAFEPGVVDLPELGVRIVRTADGASQMAYTPPARVEVRLVDAADEATLRADAAPMDPGPDWRLVAAGALGVAVAVALVVLAWRRWRARRARARPLAPAAPEVSAEAAIATIRTIARDPASTPDEVLARYRGVSDALRGYLGLPLELPATALTSTEIVGAIDGVRRRASARRSGSLQPARPLGPGDGAADERTRRLLEHIDEVKFGGARPAGPERADACRRAVVLIEELEDTRGGGAEAGRGVA